MQEFTLHDQDFRVIQRMLHEEAGIALTPAKKALVSGRLLKRLRHFGLASFRDYLGLVQSPANQAERQLMIDLLTTNETSFFREPRHFDLLTRLVAQPRRSEWRVWSAACSSGEEPYSIAMTLYDTLGPTGWSVLGSDINAQVLARAASGLYALARSTQIPREQLVRHCMRGTGSAEGTFLIGRPLRERVRFERLNLIEPLPDIGQFDVIFLRNVMIYFDMPTKRQVVEQLTTRLVPGGYLFTGHSESLQGVTSQLESTQPAVYRKPVDKRE